MNIRLLVSLLSLSAIATATFVINVDDYIKDLRSVPVIPRDIFDVNSFLTRYGYPFENHKVTTEDGYILSLHRIPHGKDDTANEREDKTKPVVLIMHGILSSSVDYFIFGPNNSLALILADLGYDVWLGNNRGNTWSRKHTKLDPDEDDAFWDFSFHELGAYDLPATIDYILTETQKEDLTYVGHSQGCTEFFVTTSLKPEYNDKIKVMVALAPAVFLQNLTNPIIRDLALFYPFVEMAINSLNITEFLPYTTLSTTLQVICSEDSGYQEICVTVLFLLFGFNSDQLDRATLPILFQDLPAGASAKEILHFLQEVKSGHFRQYDYGETKNLEIYNNSNPPDYNLKAVSAPVALYYGENDWLVDLPDMDRLIDALPNVVEDQLVGYLFNHIDFIFAKDVVNILYFDVINLINSYNGFEPITSTSPASTTKSTTRRPRPTTTTSTTESGSTNDVTTVSSTTTDSSAWTVHLVNNMQAKFGIMLVVIYLLV